MGVGVGGGGGGGEEEKKERKKARLKYGHGLIRRCGKEFFLE